MALAQGGAVLSRLPKAPGAPTAPRRAPSPPGNSVLVGSSSSSQRTADLLTTKNLHANRLASAVGQSRHLPPPSCVSTLQPLRARATLQKNPVLLCASTRERLSAMINPRVSHWIELDPRRWGGRGRQLHIAPSS